MPEWSDIKYSRESTSQDKMPEMEPQISLKSKTRSSQIIPKKITPFTVLTVSKSVWIASKIENVSEEAEIENTGMDLKLMAFYPPCFPTCFSDSHFQTQTWSLLCLSNLTLFLPVFCNPLITVTISLAGGCFCWAELFSTNNTKSYRLCMSLCSLVTSNTYWLAPH